MDQDAGSRSSSPPNRAAQSHSHIRTSCDLCKRLKIKCERQGESCLHCIDRGATCVTTPVERKKRQPNRTTSLLELESRLERMESVITASGLSAHWDAGAERPSGISDSPLADPGTLTDRLSTLLINKEGRSRFLGASSGFSLFSPQGLQWISDKTGSNELAGFISKLSSDVQNYAPKSATDLYRPLFPSEREPLPPKSVADQYVQHFFVSYNSIFPLFDRVSFNEKYDLQYSGNPPDGSAWYASLNIVLCIGCLLLQVRSQKDPNIIPEEQIWNKYFRNASSCFLDLLFDDGSLLAIQALVGMAVVQQISLQPQAVYVLTAAAARLAYGIGLHRSLNEFGLSQAEITQRKNVFWIVYFIDKSVALRLGHPSVLNDDDIGVDLPDEQRILERRPDGSVIYGIFRCQAQLARLESRIHTELYSVRAHSRSAIDRLRAVGELDKALLEWKDALPEEIQPEKAILTDEDHILPVILMHFAYYNCLTTIHRVSIHHGSWTSSHLSQSGTTPHDQRLNPRVYASQSICLAAARQSIQLLQVVDCNRVRPTTSSVIWMLLYYPLSGLLALFANTLQNPQDPQAASDLKLMDIVISYIAEPVIHVSQHTAVTARIFIELVNVARKLVEKTLLQGSKPAKRGHDEGDPRKDNLSMLPAHSGASEALSESNVSYNSPSSVFPSIEPSYQNENLLGASFTPPTTGEMPMQDSNSPQYHFQPRGTYDSFPISSQPLYSDSVMQQPDPASIIPVVSEYFEWDLANLYNFTFSQGHDGV